MILGDSTEFQRRNQEETNPRMLEPECNPQELPPLDEPTNSTGCKLQRPTQNDGCLCREGQSADLNNSTWMARLFQFQPVPLEIVCDEMTLEAKEKEPPQQTNCNFVETPEQARGLTQRLSDFLPVCGRKNCCMPTRRKHHVAVTPKEAGADRQHSTGAFSVSVKLPRRSRSSKNTSHQSNRALKCDCAKSTHKSASRKLSYSPRDHYHFGGHSVHNPQHRGGNGNYQNCSCVKTGSGVKVCYRNEDQQHHTSERVYKYTSNQGTSEFPQHQGFQHPSPMAVQGAQNKRYPYNWRHMGHQRRIPPRYESTSPALQAKHPETHQKMITANVQTPPRPVPTADRILVPSHNQLPGDSRRENRTTERCIELTPDQVKLLESTVLAEQQRHHHQPQSFNHLTDSMNQHNLPLAAVQQHEPIKQQQHPPRSHEIQHPPLEHRTPAESRQSTPPSGHLTNSTDQNNLPPAAVQQHGPTKHNYQHSHDIQPPLEQKVHAENPQSTASGPDCLSQNLSHQNSAPTTDHKLGPATSFALSGPILPTRQNRQPFHYVKRPTTLQSHETGRSGVSPSQQVQLDEVQPPPPEVPQQQSTNPPILVQTDKPVLLSDAPLKSEVEEALRAAQRVIQAQTTAQTSSDNVNVRKFQKNTGKVKMNAIILTSIKPPVEIAEEQTYTDTSHEPQSPNEIYVNDQQGTVTVGHANPHRFQRTGANSGGQEACTESPEDRNKHKKIADLIKRSRLFPSGGQSRSREDKVLYKTNVPKKAGQQLQYNPQGQSSRLPLTTGQDGQTQNATLIYPTPPVLKQLLPQVVVRNEQPPTGLMHGPLTKNESTDVVVF